ncbi:MAG: acyl-CoA synthetase FdrA [Collinsella sp.]|nr:acyl-CoA synthetase FdrA [Collinsella sp.]
MLYTVVKQNSYQDSINLMLLTNKINAMPGVAQSQIMMGTDANKDIYDAAGLLTPEAAAASPSDMVIVVESEREGVIDEVLAETEAFLADLSVKKTADGAPAAAESWEEAVSLLPDANLALFSIPGEYAAPELERALDLGLNVFSFTDNVPLADEVRLKRKAHEKGLLFMGPDCGTGVISSVPVAFTNVINPGNIGIVGASGTGIQEVTCMIDRLGGGCVHAIGTGGRDLNEAVGAQTVKDAIVALEHHDPTDVICVISKPPAPAVRDEVVDLLARCSKPTVAIFIGERPEAHEGKVHLAHTLEECARIAVDLARGEAVKRSYLVPLDLDVAKPLPADRTVVGLYSGGTLAGEAAMMISEALDLGHIIKEDGYMLRHGGYDVIDLGDDIYTQGRPHPMIDPEVRIGMMRDYAARESTGVIVFDCVLGYGCHPDMASELAGVISACIEDARAAGRELRFVGTVVGTEHDPQDYHRSVKILEDAGAIMQESNAAAVRVALAFKGIDFTEADRETVAFEPSDEPLPLPSEAVMELLTTKPRVINVGLESFNEPLRAYGAESVQYAWKPMAGGNKRMIHLLTELAKIDGVDEANERVCNRFKESQPVLVDVVPARTVIHELDRPQKTLLHAGPPITWENMQGPMRGSCIGAALFEGWAETEEEALGMLEGGEVEFIPCHHCHAVGPMGGITSANMAVLVVRNLADGTVAYCTMNEGIGAVLRFGAYSKEVIDRLHWMADELGPVLAQALKLSDGGINLNVLLARAITQGDEFHQRNMAATLNFLKEIAPLIVKTDASEEAKQRVIQFLADTDQFFLNVMMATGKSIVDYARKDIEGCVVSTMTRNGYEFGVRVSGLGDEWFVAPVNTPTGLYFTGFSEEDGCPDNGDSAICETVGVGGMAMVAAPGVTRFVGAGGFEDALNISNEMAKICVTHNPNWSIPTWDFKGACLGIDIRKVVKTGITPLINTGIAHRQAGIGQVGAGTVRAPLACFEKALEAYCAKLGIE